LHDTPFRLYEDVKFECASLITGWHDDAGGIGDGVINYLMSGLKCRLLAEIEPAGFFPLNGVAIEDDVAEFPESKLYYCAEKNLLLFLSQLPNAGWFRFLNTLIDMSSYHCHVDKIYSVGGLISLDSTSVNNRKLVGVSNVTAMKKLLVQSGVDTQTDYETPEGQRPTLSSFLMWVARSRNIPMATLWSQVPFYLASVDDPQSWRLVLEFFDRELKLGLSFDEINEEIEDHNKRIADARVSIPDLNSLMGRVEASEVLSPEDNDKLVNYIEDALGY
jgi:proteasome assembly chaperone (PAC2) family protein